MEPTTDVSFPQSTAIDSAHDWIRAICLDIAGTASNFLGVDIGNTSQLLFDTFIKKPLEKRRDHWFGVILPGVLSEIKDKLGEVAAKQKIYEQSFQDKIIQTSSIAYRTSDPTKIEYIKNILLQAGISTENFSDSYLEQMIRTMENLTPLHIKILWTFSKSGHSYVDGSDPFTEAKDRIKNTYKDMSGGQIDSIIKDLFSHGLIGTHKDFDSIRKSITESMVLSDYGSDFLEVIFKTNKANKEKST